MEVAEVIAKDEAVKAVAKKHWISIAPLIAAALFIEVIAIYGFYLLARYGANTSIGFGMVGLIALAALGYLLGYSFLWIYRQNRLIITDKNLYQVTQNSLFSQSVSQFGMERLQDVTAAQNGFFATVLNYGDVTVETAGEEDNFIFRQAPDPKKIAAMIMSSHKESLPHSPIHPHL